MSFVRLFSSCSHVLLFDGEPHFQILVCIAFHKGILKENNEETDSDICLG